MLLRMTETAARKFAVDRLVTGTLSGQSFLLALNEPVDHLIALAINKIEGRSSPPVVILSTGIAALAQRKFVHAVDSCLDNPLSMIGSLVMTRKLCALSRGLSLYDFVAFDNRDYVTATTAAFVAAITP